jgi:hypothetical protein
MQLRGVHDLTQLWPRLLPSLRYVVVAVQNHAIWNASESFQDMDNEETIRVVKNCLFRYKSVKTRICDYLYHDGADQKLLRKKSFCLHFSIDIDRFGPNDQGTGLLGLYTRTCWRFLVDLDTNPVQKYIVEPVRLRMPAGQISCSTIGATL